MSLPTDKQARKERPMFSGLLAYFPDALAEVAHVSFVGNQQHNPGQPLHWAREKSTDHLDCVERHLTDHASGSPIDTDKCYHLAKAIWRLLAELQLIREAAQEKPKWTELGTYTPVNIPQDSEWQTAEKELDFEYQEAVKLRNEAQVAAVKAGEYDYLNAGKPRGTIYISGPMRGKPEHNFPAFDTAAQFFHIRGYKVINPADMDREDKKPMTQRDYARRDINALFGSTHIALLPGWEKSVGATAEYRVAFWLGLTILDATTGKELK